MIPLCLRLFKKLESLFLNCTRYTTDYSSQRYVSYLIAEMSGLRIVLIVGIYWNKVHIWDCFSNYFPFGGCGGSEKNHVPKDTSLEWSLSARFKCRVLLNAYVLQAASVLRLFCCSTCGTCCKRPEGPGAASRSFWQNSVVDSWLHVVDEFEGLWFWNGLLPSDRKLYESAFPYPSTHPTGQWESLTGCMLYLSLDASQAKLL